MTPGIYKLTMEAYLALPAFSSSLAHKILVASPLHAWTDSPLNPNRIPWDSEASDIGTLAHACLLEGGTDKVRVIDPQNFPSRTGTIPAGWTNKAIRCARDDARNNGEIPILVENFAVVRAMVNAAKEYIERSELAGIFDSGEPEPSIAWNENGLLCKARPDWLTIDRAINLHYKTTKRSAQPEAWIRSQLSGMGYDIAAVLYERAVLANCPEVKRCDSIFLVQEQDPPYSCSLVGLSPPVADLATRKMRRAMDTWQQCLAAGVWPAYPARICWAELLPWQQSQFEERELQRDVDGDQFTDEELKEGIPL